jgi:dephospho-CoA kinase
MILSMTGSSKPVIGLAGGIGAGKSVVATMLAELGCMISDADAAGREALRDSAIRKQLLQWWGETILDRSGAVDRAKVATIVFNDPRERIRLEALTHPWIHQRRHDEFAFAGPEIKAFVIDAPLLFETNLDDECDAVIFVDAPEKLRRERVRRERGWDAAELARRESVQLALDEKRKRADHVISNDGDLSGLRAQVHDVFHTIMLTCSR